METKHWKITNLDSPEIQEAGRALAAGEVVAIPTETVYGLGGNAQSDEAVKKIFAAKGRPADNPLIVHIADVDNLESLVQNVPDTARRLIDAYWPGPMTIILPVKPGISEYVTAGLTTVGVRMPGHPVARAVIRAAGCPVAAPSANLSGKPSPTTGDHVIHDLQDKIYGVADAGPTAVGVESTVVDCSGDRPVLLRPGSITAEDIKKIAGSVETDPSIGGKNAAPKSPGMKYKHYAPAAPLYLVEGGTDRLADFIRQADAEGKSVGVLTTDEHLAELEKLNPAIALSAGKREDLSTIAAGLYRCLRQFDEADVDIILSETFPDSGIGGAIMNRLNKAAAGRL